MQRRPLLFTLILCAAIAAQPNIEVLSVSEHSFDFASTDRKDGISKSLIGFIHTYMWEILGVVLLIVYGMYFYVGRNKNVRIVNNWYAFCLDIIFRLATYQTLLESQFSSIGISGNHGMFIRESFDQFRLFCSGRKNCRGILFDFKVHLEWIT